MSAPDRRDALARWRRGIDVVVERRLFEHVELGVERRELGVEWVERRERVERRELGVERIERR